MPVSKHVGLQGFVRAWKLPVRLYVSHAVWLRSLCLRICVRADGDVPMLDKELET